MLSPSEQEELELLRKSAMRFMTDPLEKAFFVLESLLDSYKRREHRVDTVMPVHAFHVLATAVIELKREVLKK